jgi:Zn-dependent peptidase ImmA (M78 family)
LALRSESWSLEIDKEIEAHQFAAELLMPEDFVLKDSAKLQKDMEPEDAVAQLASSYWDATSRNSLGAKSL